MSDLSHYGDPPRKPRDETRTLRLVARVVLFAVLGFVATALAVALLGWG